MLEWWVPCCAGPLSFFEVVDEPGWSCLLIAAKNGHLEMCQVLLDQEVDCNVEDKDQWIALHCAAKERCLDMVVHT